MPGKKRKIEKCNIPELEKNIQLTLGHRPRRPLLANGRIGRARASLSVVLGGPALVLVLRLLLLRILCYRLLTLWIVVVVVGFSSSSVFFFFLDVELGAVLSSGTSIYVSVL